MSSRVNKPERKKLNEHLLNCQDCNILKKCIEYYIIKENNKVWDEWALYHLKRMSLKSKIMNRKLKKIIEEINDYE
jgi:hypothetical protein